MSQPGAEIGAAEEAVDELGRPRRDGPAESPWRRELAALERLDLERLALPVLALAVIASGVLLYHLTRSSSFFGDDWDWIATRRSGSIHTYLSPYDGHLSVIPVAIYHVWFAAFGIDSYVPYRALAIALSLVVGLLVYALSVGRVGRFCAMLVAALVLFVGPGWQDTMWAFQIGWELALAFGLVALLALDRRTPAADAIACVTTFASICCTSFGLAIAIGIAVDVALHRRRWRDGWIPGVPILLYVIWALHYHPTGVELSAVTGIPGNIVQALDGGLAGIVGLSGASALDATGTALIFGTPLLAALAVWGVRLAARRRFSARAATYLAALLVFSALTTLGRSFENPIVSRYVYADCVLVALLVVELARGTRPSRVVQAGVAVLAFAAVVSNVYVLRSGGEFLRAFGAQTDADVYALNLARGSVPADYVAQQLPDHQYIYLQAGDLFSAERSLGSPAFDAAQMRTAPGPAQDVADAELVGTHAILLSPGTSPRRPAGTAPGVQAGPGVRARRTGSCVQVSAPATSAPGAAAASATLVLAPGAYRLTAGEAPVDVSARRFGPTGTSLGSVSPGRSGIVLVRRDAASAGVPWRLGVSGMDTLRACDLG